MRKKIYIISLIALILVLIISIIVEINRLNEPESKIAINVENRTFKQELLEDILDNLKNKAKENDVKLGDFSLVRYDDNTYFKVELPDIKDSNYLIHYEGINVNTISLNFTQVNEENIKKIENSIITLIQVSDPSISRENSLKIFSKLSESLDKDKNKSLLTYKNGVSYSIELDQTGGMIFYAK